MASIRVNTVSLAALSSSNSACSSSTATCFDDSLNENVNDFFSCPIDFQQRESQDESAWSHLAEEEDEHLETQVHVQPEAPEAHAAFSQDSGIDIPGQKRDGSRLTRRVSFNLRDNSVLQLPSNAAIGKIASARARHRLSLSGELDGGLGGRTPDENEQLADRRARALLPHGASPDLLDPSFAMTSLYVKRGHIHALEHHYLSPGDNSGLSLSINEAEGMAATVKGVLKPFTPSPVDSSFFIKNALGNYGPADQQDALDEEEEEEEESESTRNRRLRHQKKQEQPKQQPKQPKKQNGRKSKKGGNKKSTSSAASSASATPK
ncbi:hypothetical protein GGI07_002486 [Coemansia sp. Benny D115]|nr:hypothetical protein GGI07_002486 [Coemansia sp. Benny D115]